MRNHEQSTPNMYYTCTSTLVRCLGNHFGQPYQHTLKCRLQRLHFRVCFAGNVVPKFQW